jgi:RNA polymerase sigma-70 factor (ECF subfamily)
MDSANEAPQEQQRLLEAVRRGDEPAWNELIDRFRPELIRLAEAHLRGAKADPSGVVQDALVKAWVHRAQVEAPSQEELLGWLKAIVQTTALDALRHIQRQKRDARRDCPLPEDSAGEVLLAQAGGGPSTAAMRREEQDRLKALVGRLSERDQAIVRLRVSEHRDWPEIAKELGSTAEAVKQAYHRAVQRLKEGAGGAAP